MKTWNKEQIKVALPITRDELIALGVPVDELEQGEIRGALKTYGPWQIPVSYKALCVSAEWTPKDQQRYTAERESETAYGIRTLTNVRQNGHALEGQVSVNGRKVRGFTSSQLFELPDGKLINIATIHACLNDAAKGGAK